MNIRLIAAPAALILSLASLSVFHLGPSWNAAHAAPSAPLTTPRYVSPTETLSARSVVTLDTIYVTPTPEERAAANRSS